MTEKTKAWIMILISLIVSYFLLRLLNYTLVPRWIRLVIGFIWGCCTALRYGKKAGIIIQ